MQDNAQEGKSKKELLNLIQIQEEELELLRAALELSEVGFTLSDHNGVVLRVNPSQIRITGHDPRKTVGRSMLDIQTENRNQSATMKVLETKAPAIIDQVLPSGKSYLVYGRPYFDTDGNLKYVICNLVDSTEHNYMRQELENAKHSNAELEKTVSALQEIVDMNNLIVYSSKSMHRLISLCDKVASFDSTILISGQSGVGKEVIADYIQRRSNRVGSKYIKINCAAIPENLLESELFGYEPGAFTNARSQGKKGILEIADGGTVLLDEVGELPLHLQTKMLRVIQEGEFYHVGGTVPLYTDVRILAATNSDLDEMINEGTFRKDLYYRLSVIQIKIPSLSERREDIPLLTRHFLTRFNAKYNLHKEMTNQATDYLMHRDYEGNVRDLQNVIERIILLAPRDIIGIQDIEMALNTDFSLNNDDLPGETEETFSTLKSLVANYEKELLQRYWFQYGSASKIAEVLRTNQPTISRKLHSYGIISNKNESDT